MKLALAQSHSQVGEVKLNSERHRHWIRRAKALGADLIVFPELSLTAYEPELADQLAVSAEDGMWQSWQAFSEGQQVAFALGMPIRKATGIEIGLILFRPGRPHRIYAKQFLHADEEPYFIPGQTWDGYLAEANLAFAICYELSVEAHAESAEQHQAKIYLASVAKFQDGIVPAHERLAAIAKQQGIVSLMVNAIGAADGGYCAGQSAVWNSEGQLIAQMESEEEGLLLYDTATGRSTIVLV